MQFIMHQNLLLKEHSPARSFIFSLHQLTCFSVASQCMKPIDPQKEHFSPERCLDANLHKLLRLQAKNIQLVSNTAPQATQINTHTHWKLTHEHWHIQTELAPDKPQSAPQLNVCRNVCTSDSRLRHLSDAQHVNQDEESGRGLSWLLLRSEVSFFFFKHFYKQLLLLSAEISKTGTLSLNCSCSITPEN